MTMLVVSGDFHACGHNGPRGRLTGMAERFAGQMGSAEARRRSASSSSSALCSTRAGTPVFRLLPLSEIEGWSLFFLEDHVEHLHLGSFRSQSVGKNCN